MYVVQEMAQAAIPSLCHGLNIENKLTVHPLVWGIRQSKDSTTNNPGYLHICMYICTPYPTHACIKCYNKECRQSPASEGAAAALRAQQ